MSIAHVNTDVSMAHQDAVNNETTEFTTLTVRDCPRGIILSEVRRRAIDRLCCISLSEGASTDALSYASMVGAM